MPHELRWFLTIEVVPLLIEAFVVNLVLAGLFILPLGVFGLISKLRSLIDKYRRFIDYLDFVAVFILVHLLVAGFILNLLSLLNLPLPPLPMTLLGLVRFPCDEVFLIRQLLIANAAEDSSTSSHPLLRHSGIRHEATLMEFAGFCVLPIAVRVVNLLGEIVEVLLPTQWRGVVCGAAFADADSVILVKLHHLILRVLILILAWCGG